MSGGGEAEYSGVQWSGREVQAQVEFDMCMRVYRVWVRVRACVYAFKWCQLDRAP